MLVGKRGGGLPLLLRRGSQSGKPSFLCRGYGSLPGMYL